MDYAAAVRFVQRVGDLAAEFEDLLKGDGTLFQAPRQCLAFEALHDEVIRPVLMADVVQHADVRVLQTGNSFSFALKALLANGIILEFRRPNPNDARPTEPPVPPA